MGEVIYFIGGVVQPFLLYMVWALMLEPRWTKRPFWCYSIFAVIVIQLPTAIRVLVEEGLLRDIMGYGQLVVLIVFAIILFKNKLWVKIFVVMLYYMCALVAEVAALAILGDAVLYIDVYGDSMEALILNVLAMIILFSLLGVVVILWNFLLKKRTIPKNILLYLIFPIGQVCMLELWSGSIHAGDFTFKSNLTVLLGLIIGFVGDAILFYVMFMQGEKEEMKHRLEETEKLMDMERRYYESVQEQQEEMAKIRHDFNNQLTAALQIAESGESEKSKEILHHLREKIAQSRKHVWCTNAIVNAVLVDKQRLCENNGVQFDAEVSVSDELPVEQLHLCSIFSNLMDNAIHAALEVDRKEAFVSVKTSLKEKYLYVKVENSSAEPKAKKPQKGHGYGLEIVKNIVAQYNGEYHAEWKDGVYSAFVVLELNEK